VETIGATQLLSSAQPTPRANTVGALGSDDFLRLLITELGQQDPLEPVGNAELLQQISSIREIELSTTLTDSLTKLTSQQRIASASGLIGQFVSGIPDEAGNAERGVVTGVRFTQDGSPVLQLANGSELSLDHVSTIESPMRAAEALVGQAVVGVDRRGTSQPEVVEGVVAGVRMNDQGRVVLELDTGLDLRFEDVAGIVSSEII